MMMKEGFQFGIMIDRGLAVKRNGTDRIDVELPVVPNSGNCLFVLAIINVWK
jgi:hypothetical protein